MRKIISMCALAVALLVAAPAQAQVKFGVKAGLNLSKVSTSGALGDNFKNDNRAGYFFGPMLDVKVPLVGLGIDGALMYNQRNGKVGYEYAASSGDLATVELNEVNDVTQHSIAIPVNLKKSWGLGGLASMFVAVGPQFDFTIGGKKWKDMKVVKNVKWKDSNVSLNLGAGVVLLDHVQAGLGYNIALGKTAEVSDDSSLGIAKNALTSKTNSWQFHVAYLF
ncbi:MAG: PorT family protein [Bacteroidaceae bacterium]|nr:PorT family protein [Bacteroidaceae bacterium]